MHVGVLVGGVGGEEEEEEDNDLMEVDWADISMMWENNPRSVSAVKRYMMFCEEYLPDGEDFLCETKERGYIIPMMMVCV